MNHDWMIELSMDGNSEIAQICMCSGNSETHLKHCGESEALLFIDKDEIYIERLGEIPVEIERDSRKKLIKTACSTRILPNDLIRVGNSEYHIHGIYRMNQPRRMASPFGKYANKVILTSAAAIMVAVMPACNSAKQSEITDQPKCENGENKIMMCLNDNRYQKCGEGRWELVEECNNV